jgi:hypothetical protein
MITKIEGARDKLTPLRVYHRAGSLPGRGPDEKFAWTHPMSERSECTACNGGTIPDEIARSPR